MARLYGSGELPAHARPDVASQSGAVARQVVMAASWQRRPNASEGLAAPIIDRHGGSIRAMCQDVQFEVMEPRRRSELDCIWCAAGS
jgi:hypothetical protein